MGGVAGGGEAAGGGVPAGGAGGGVLPDVGGTLPGGGCPVPEEEGGFVVELLLETLFCGEFVFVVGLEELVFAVVFVPFWFTKARFPFKNVFLPNVAL